MSNSDNITQALTDIIGSLDLVIPENFSNINNLNTKHQQLIQEIQKKLTTLINNNKTSNGKTNYIENAKTNENFYSNGNNNNQLNTPPRTDDTDYTDYSSNLDYPDTVTLGGSVGGRRKRNRSLKNKRKSSEEQPEKKTEQEETNESPKPQKKSFFSRFNPFKTKGGRRSRKHRTTKKGGRRHK
jgi:hypothetical protein